MLLRPRRLLALALLAAALAWAPAAQAQAQTSEAELKAEITFRALLFVQWPAQLLRDEQALRLCVLDESPLARALRAEGPPYGVLWIADELGLLESGAMLNLQVENAHIVFDVELAAMRRAGLDISAKVLRLARYVKR